VDLADRLVQLRKAHGWTQVYAAEVIDIQQSYLSKLENGHYVPSAEVLLKLCNAYNIKSDELLSSNPKKVKPTIFISVFLTIAVALILIGQLALIFPQTYYNYKTTPIELTAHPKVKLNFHLTDKYLGEKYVKTIDDVDYTFELIAQRTISRKENRWLITFGILIISFTLSYLAWPLIKKYIVNEKSE